MNDVIPKQWLFFNFTANEELFAVKLKEKLMSIGADRQHIFNSLTQAKTIHSKRSFCKIKISVRGLLPRWKPKPKPENSVLKEICETQTEILKT